MRRCRYRKPGKKSLASRVAFWSITIIIVLLCFRSCCNNLLNDSCSDHLISENPTLIVDAGHGGFDPGAQGLNGIVEKDLNLAISLKLREMLNFMGFNVVMVRDGDYSLESDCSKSIAVRKKDDLHNRLKMCETYNNSIFISIHQNKFSKANCSGTQIFYGGRNEKSKELAEKLQKNFINDLKTDSRRDVKKIDKSVFIIYNARCPAVLVECGFISNYHDAQLLVNDEYQMKISYVIAKSVLEFIGEQNKPKFTFLPFFNKR